MYLRSIRMKNVGPITDLSIEMPFTDGRPKPLVLVGRNGSGKTTVISFIVNVMTTLKQYVYEGTEVATGKVYRMRLPLAINEGAEFYFAALDFDDGVSLREWQLAKPRTLYGASDYSSVDASWRSIQGSEIDLFELKYGALTEKHKMQKMLETTCMLFFPADRFEPPDWLNGYALASDLALPETTRLREHTARRIIQKNRLKAIMEWIYGIVFDYMVYEYSERQILFDSQYVNARFPKFDKSFRAFQSVTSILKAVVCDSDDEKITIGIGERNSRLLSATVTRNGVVVRQITNLLSLSSGESALFCLFASILMDADQTQAPILSLEEISGIVIIDEADLHLHVGFQYSVLPRLISMFPNIQFVLSVHSPLAIIGMEKIMPSGF